MISFEDITKANELIKSTEIKGKDYAEVNQRIKAFRSLYPQGFIKTYLLSDENGICKFKASVGYYDEDGNEFELGNGTAYEKENSTFINKTSYIENCETSAVGRALGMCGFGIDTSVASYEEVKNAKKNQGKLDIREMDYKILIAFADQKGVSEDELKDKYKVDDLHLLTKEQYAEAVNYLKDKIDYKTLITLANKKGVSEARLENKYKVDDLHLLTKEQCDKAINGLKDMEDV